MTDDKREVGETGAAREQRQQAAKNPDADQGEVSALGGHTATRSSTRPTPPDEKAGA